jgi:hypothetical protein
VTSFKYNLRRSVRPYLSKALTRDILVFRDHGSASAATAMMSEVSGVGTGSGGEEQEQGITMEEVVNRLKAIETVMHPLVPLKDQLSAIETTLAEQGQQQQLLSAGLLRVERNQGPGHGTPNGRRRADEEDDDEGFPTTCKIEFPKYDGVGDPLPWLNCWERYFRVLHMTENRRVAYVLFYLMDDAQLWYHRLELNAVTVLHPIGEQAFRATPHRQPHWRTSSPAARWLDRRLRQALHGALVS